jgi:hypothetical protein
LDDARLPGLAGQQAAALFGYSECLLPVESVSQVLSRILISDHIADPVAEVFFSSLQ